MSTTHAGMTPDQRLDLAQAAIRGSFYSSFQSDAYNAEFDAGDTSSAEDLADLMEGAPEDFQQEGWPISGDALAVRKATA
jgi:hypothetical protein